jgi:hypothetical protein
MTFAGELAKTGHKAWLSVGITGIGRRTGATLASLRDAYRWTMGATVGASDGSLNLDRIIPGLEAIPGGVSESIDIRTGKTSLGQLGVELRLDAPTLADHGWAMARPTFDALSPRASVSRYRLLVAVNFAQLVLQLDTVSAWSWAKPSGSVPRR